jgi:sec-independent protein translocase protein TatA
MFYSKPWLDVLIVVGIVLLFFGPKRLPQLGKSLGQGMREFKDSITGSSSDDDGDEHPALNEAPAADTASAPSETTASPATEAGSAKVASSEHRS